jgi:hypothetical protein
VNWEDDAGFFGKPAVVLRHVFATASGESSALGLDRWVYTRIAVKRPLVRVRECLRSVVRVRYHLHTT